METRPDDDALLPLKLPPPDHSLSHLEDTLGVAPLPPKTPLWGAGTGLLVWFGSVLLLLAFNVVGVLAYLGIRFYQTREMPQDLSLDWLMALLTIASTFPAHLLTLLLCWWVMTDRGRQPLRASLGWEWHAQFKWVHAVALAALMIGVGLGLERVLDHQETDLEKLLKLGASIRYAVALLAVFSAPLVEELVYRGVVYQGFERSVGRYGSILIVTLLFALVHVPQYWGSQAALTAILSLSLVLTLLRAYTGKLLPCIATHFVFNGVQAVVLLVTGEEAEKASQSMETAINLLSNVLSPIGSLLALAPSLLLALPHAAASLFLTPVWIWTT
jgi:membrane protease YdiL (CAAX protease family)